MTISGSIQKIETWDLSDSAIVESKVMYSHDKSDYFDMMDSKDLYKVWKSKVMSRSVAISIGEQSLRLNKVQHLADPLIFTINHSSEQLGQ